MPKSTLKLSDVKRRVLTALGSSSVDIEIKDADLEVFVEDAVDVYNAHRPRVRTAPLVVTAEQKKYLIEHPGLIGIVDVQFVRSEYVSRTQLDPFSYDVLTGKLLNGGDSLAEFDQVLQSIEMNSQILGSSPDWLAEDDAEGDTYLYIDVPSSRFLCCYQYAWGVTPDDNATTGLTWVQASDVSWFVDFCAAKAKQVLGRVLRKHGGTPTPDGVDPTDGEALVQEGREDEQKLREEIKKKRRPIPPVIG